MPSNVHKKPISKGSPAANSFSKKQPNNTAALKAPDNRPVAVAQRKLQKIANNSLQVKQLAAVQKMANNQSGGLIQLKTSAEDEEPIQKKSGPAELPGTLNSGIEHLPGMDISDIKTQYNSAHPAQLIKHQKQAMNNHGMQMKKVPVDGSTGHFTFQLMPNPKVYQLVSSGDVAQLIYLHDRSPDSKEEKPHWIKGKKPPFSYIRSGAYDDKEHGPDALYERLGAHDLFYGIQYEDDPKFDAFTAKLQVIADEKKLKLEGDNIRTIVELYEKAKGLTFYEAQICQQIFGGSSGWDQFQKYLKPEDEKGESKETLADVYKALNPTLPWGKDEAALGCQAAMIGAIANGGSVRFMLNGMNEISGIIQGTKYQEKITSDELRFAYYMLNRPIKVTPGKTIQPEDMKNVFFYVNRVLVSAARLLTLKNTQTTGTAAVAEEKVPGKKGCYITTACTTFMGLADDCEELTLLRYFRDNYLLQKPNGRALVALYYKYAPAIADEISKRKNKDEILRKLYGIINQCAGAIKQNNNEFAFKTYCEMVMELKAQFA